MRCPKCGFLDDKVVDSRSVREGFGVRRRRECLGCGHRFSTYESVIWNDLMVVKRNGARQEFDVDKIRRGVELACRKLSVSAEDIDKLVEELSMALQRDFDKEVPAAEIGNRVMKALRKLDSVAYVRFASIYRNFKDVDEFIEEIRALR